MSTPLAGQLPLNLKGLTTTPSQASPDAVADADQQLYRANQAGRNGVRVASGNPAPDAVEP